ncbi:expressed protein [Phakopsora pachyrhizi]|uniref:Non-structural maintenance of chromosomes element 1 homolog n=1 Tax=Phakopsora pachyrhizi TaxID=170000 RepID=A0AAV0AK61_PHAPC|nr:expressed protein [Phakopsora pachyrhizi]
MLLRRAAPVKSWLAIWKNLATTLGFRVSEEEFEPFWRQINEHIENFGFKIARVEDQGVGPISNRSQQLENSESSAIDVRTPGKMWMALVNTRSDEMSKLGTELSMIEISLFKKLVDRIILAPNYRFCISTHDAIRLSSKLDPPMRKSDSQYLLAVLVKKGWLSLSPTGFYTLSVRCQLELSSYLTENFNDEDQPPSCVYCKDIVMRGYKCEGSGCSMALHVICENKQARRGGTCTSCKTLFICEKHYNW